MIRTARLLIALCVFPIVASAQDDPLAWFPLQVVHGNCIYVISGGWDAQKQELRPDYRKHVSEGSLSPDFCFPLQMGGEWSNADLPWRIEPPRDDVGSFLSPAYANAIHIFSSHFGSGGWMDV